MGNKTVSEEIADSEYNYVVCVFYLNTDTITKLNLPWTVLYSG